MLFKEIVDERTHARTTDIEGSQKLTEHPVLRWAKNTFLYSANKAFQELLVQDTIRILVLILVYTHYFLSITHTFKIFLRQKGEEVK